MLGDIDKASSCYRLVLSVVLYDSEATSHLPTPLDEDLSPLAYGVGLSNGAVIALHIRGRLYALDITAGLKALVCLPYESVPISNRTAKEAQVDIVNGVLRKSPLLGAIVDLAGYC